jgi:hypothetical protein
MKNFIPDNFLICQQLFYATEISDEEAGCRQFPSQVSSVPTASSGNSSAEKGYLSSSVMNVSFTELNETEFNAENVANQSLAMIDILRALMINSSQKAFSIPSEANFQFLNNTDSVDSTLLQISQGTHDTLVTGRKKMAEIKSRFSFISEDINLMLRYLSKKRKSKKVRQMASPIERTLQAATDSQTKLTEVAYQFEQLCQLTGEFVNATRDTVAFQEVSLRDNCNGSKANIIKKKILHEKIHKLNSQRKNQGKYLTLKAAEDELNEERFWLDINGGRLLDSLTFLGNNYNGYSKLNDLCIQLHKSWSVAHAMLTNMTEYIQSASQLYSQLRNSSDPARLFNEMKTLFRLLDEERKTIYYNTDDYVNKTNKYILKTPAGCRDWMCLGLGIEQVEVKV